MVYGKNNVVCGMVCWRYGTGKHSIWYGMLAVWDDGTVSRIYYFAKSACWSGMFQCIRSVRVEYVVRISFATTLHIHHWKVFEN